MNRNDRSKLMIRTRQFMFTVSEQCSSYLDFIEEISQAETDKLENIPESLMDSKNVNSISESIEALDSTKELVNEITNILDQIPETLEIEIKKSRKKTELREIQYEEPCKLPEGKEKRTERIQLVVTPSLGTMLKSRSVALKMSTNELFNRILQQYLDGEG